jgi:hypothetical protein
MLQDVIFQEEVKGTRMELGGIKDLYFSAPDQGKEDTVGDKLDRGDLLV